MIVVVVNWFTKLAHFIPIQLNDSPIVAKAYLENVWNYHSFPEDVVSNRDGTFAEQSCTDLNEYLRIEQSTSTAFHAQTEGPTERIVQVLDPYLQLYGSNEQTDFTSLLAIAEYAYN